MKDLINILTDILINAPKRNLCTDLENKMYDDMENLLKNLQLMEA